MTDKEFFELFVKLYVEMVIDDIEEVEPEPDLFESGKKLGLISALKTFHTSLICFEPDLADKIFDYDLDKKYL